MEMEPIHLNNDDNSIEESSFEQLIVPSSPKISGISGDPEVNPRVGDGYQAEIPPMISDLERVRLLLNPFDSQFTVDGSHSFLMGLPIPIAWIHNKINSIEDEGCRMSNPDNPVHANRSSKSKTSRKNNIMKNKSSKQKMEPLDLGLDDGMESKPAKLGHKVARKANLAQLHKSKHYDPVPGSLNEPWSDAEVDSFIVGLYIFGKNFIQIERFMENKKMGEILSFYYGEFYRSDGYRRWSDCQKTRRKKCIYGQKIFVGWRQYELLSRLQPHVPEHSHNAFLEVSTAFSEGKFSLEDYVSNLKAIVGIQALVDAIGIGKGKEDLTSLAMEPAKSNPLFTVCPIGKACSSLTSSDIIKLLTGGFRLSKARCNDIFWEAVWPRLLAKGWHSEQPKNQGYSGSNPYLVFLIPGVKKFSRRKLVKGSHYFDSVSDVLSKVASEPKLIELETEEARGSSCNEEDRWVADVPSGQDDPSVQKIQRYLKPRVSSYNLNIMRFTVVDSGLGDGGKLSKIREMRYAPDDLKVKSLITSLSSSIEMIFLEKPLNNKLDAINISLDGEKNNDNVKCEKKIDGCVSNHTKFTIVDTSLIYAGKSSKVRELRYSPVDIVTSEMTDSSRKNEGDSSEDSLDGHVPDTASMLSNREKNVNKSNHSEDVINSSGSEQKALNQDIKKKLVESLKDNNNVSNQNQSTRTIKHKFSRRSRSGHSNNLVPVVKRRRLTACSNSEVSHVIENFSVSLRSEQEGSCCALNLPEGGSNIFQVNPPRKLSLTTSLSEDALQESTEGVLGATCFDIGTSHGENVKHQTPSLLDLNLPHVPLDSGNDEPALMDVESSQEAIANNTCFPSNSDRPDPNALSVSIDASPAVEQPNLNPRRQSTRNRPLTTRALEALECGFFGVKRQKGMQVHTSEIPFSTSAHWVHSKVKVTSSHGNVGSGIEKDKEGDVKEGFNKKDFVDKTPD